MLPSPRQHLSLVQEMTILEAKPFGPGAASEIRSITAHLRQIGPAPQIRAPESGAKPSRVSHRGTRDRVAN